MDPITWFVVIDSACGPTSTVSRNIFAVCRFTIFTRQTLLLYYYSILPRQVVHFLLPLSIHLVFLS
jgi:hypothetical protein